MRKLGLGTLILATALVSAPSIAIERQQGWNWCWAASLQDVLSDRGISTSQQEVAARLTGWPMDRPARIEELIMLANSYGLTAWRAGRPGNPIELQRSIESGRQIIAFVQPSVGPVGHFVVIKSIDPTGAVWIADPATGRTAAYPLAELYNGLRWMDSVVIQ